MTARIFGTPLARPRLLDRSDRLADAVDSAQHVLVRADPGSGRTTLLTQWGRTPAPRVEGVWVTVPRTAPSTAAWWSLVLRLLAQARLLRDPRPDPSHGPDGPASVRVLSRLAGPVVLVIDDLDHLPPPVRTSVLAVADAGPLVRLVVSARAGWEPDVDLPGTAVVDDLALTVEEVASHTGAPAALAARVHAAVLAHPVGLRLVRVEPGPDPAAATAVEMFRDGGHAVGAVVPEVDGIVADLDRADPAVDHEAVLRAWALADPLTSAAAQVLTPQAPVREILDRAARAGVLALERHPDGSERARLSAPVLTVLRRRPSPLDAAGLRRFARWALDAGDLPQALRAAGHAQDLDLASAALRAGGLPLLRDHGTLLVEHFERTPVRRLQQHPVLALALGLALNSRRQHRLRATEALLAAAAVGRVTRSPSGTDRALLPVVESVAMRLTGVGDGGLAAARRASRILHGLDADDRAALGALASELHLHAGLSLFYGGAEDDAVDELEASAAAALPDSPNLHAWSVLAGVNALRGDLAEARAWRASALDGAWSPGSVDDYPGVFLRVAQSVLALEEGDPAAAREWLDRVWHVIPTVEHWTVLVHVRALVDIHLHEPLEGIERATAVRRSRRTLLGPSESERRRLDETEALLHLAAGDGAAAGRILRRHHRADARSAVAQARLALAQGRGDLALARLNRAAVLGLPTPRARAEHAALEAAALLRLGPAGAAEASVRRLRAQVRSSGLTTPLVLVPPPEGRELARRLHDVAPLPAAAPYRGAPGAPRLTPRERIVLQELVRSASPADIARTLTVSPNTVKTQLRGLYRKLGAGSRNEALTAAAGLGLLQPPDDPA